MSIIPEALRNSTLRLMATMLLALSQATVLANTIPSGKCVGVLKPIFTGVEPFNDDTLVLLIEIDFDRRVLQAAARHKEDESTGSVRFYSEVYKDVAFTLVENKPFTGAFSMLVPDPEEGWTAELHGVTVNNGQGILITGDLGETAICHKR